MADTQFRLVKLGGAAITNKSIKETLDSEVLKETSRCLSDVINVERCARTVIVHGAGSFGHQTAHATGLVKGDLNLSTVRSGLVETRYVSSFGLCKELTSEHDLCNTKTSQATIGSRG